MFNIAITRQGHILTINIDTQQEQGPSSSGKSVIVATTAGNVAIPGTDLKLGLNLYRPVRR